jgi:AcrR family transcriptional regulator
MLDSGPRATPREAEQNQRDRLFGSMVACCAEKGYEGTTVADLIATAGVSRRDFYKHFNDKQACFLATLDEILSATGRATARRMVSEGSERQLGRSGAFAGLVDLVVAQPAAAKLCLVESYAAGPAAVGRIEATMDVLADLLGKSLAAKHGRPLPKEMVQAMGGGLRKMLHTRLHRGREAELVPAVSQLLELMLAYEPPPRPLRSPRRRVQSPPERGPTVFTDDPAERIIEATLRQVDKRGYPASTIAEIAEDAQISLSTFYAHFEGKAEALDAALYSRRARLIGIALPAYQRARNWPESIRALTRATYGALAAEPEFARVLTTDVLAAGHEAVERLDLALESAQWPFREGRKFPASPQLDDITVEAITACCYAFLCERVHRDGPESLPEAVPTATYLALCPFLGAEEACGVARG